MKKSYLNNITEEGSRYRAKIAPGCEIFNRKLKPSKVNHLVKLIKYRDRAYNGGRDDNRFQS